MLTKFTGQGSDRTILNCYHKKDNVGKKQNKTQQTKTRTEKDSQRINQLTSHFQLP